MNKRMLELYALAHLPCTAIDPSNNMPYETTRFSADKFSELIVRECIESVKEDMHSGHSHSDFSTGYDAALEMAVSNIKEKFGVEE